MALGVNGLYWFPQAEEPSLSNSKYDHGMQCQNDNGLMFYNIAAKDIMSLHHQT